MLGVNEVTLGMPIMILMIRNTLVTLLLAVAVAAPATAASPERDPLPTGIPNSLLTEHGRVRVIVMVRSTVGNLNALSAPLSGAAKARQLAQSNPGKKTAEVARIASLMDAERNAALQSVRRELAPDLRRNDRVQTAIRALRGEVIDSSIAPSTVTAVIDATRLKELARVRGVVGARASSKPVSMNSPVDGSQTWHDAGFTGAGSSADGLGGPDYLAFDGGVRLTHQAYRRRQVGDPANGVGSGPSIVVTPAGRSAAYNGDEHGNAIGASVASTDTTISATTGPPFPPTWTLKKGLAFGLDKLEDPVQAQSPTRWSVGLPQGSEAGVLDLPEVLNYSAGSYMDTTDWSDQFANDAIVANFGITNTVSAGNCGAVPSGYTGCNNPGDTTHRVSAPGTGFNTITLGGITTPDPYNSGSWLPWDNSSPGPTWGGRKKPDLVSTVNASVCPNFTSDTTYGSCGTGTSFAAPKAAAGAVLLASTGVYSPVAQKAILINSATPIQSQTYWTPRTGWGALNLDGAFYQRGNYQNGSVTPTGSNGVRFFKQLGVAPGDRTTLVWNRRMFNGLSGTGYTVTDLDLAQVDATSGSSTAFGGSDAADTVDTNQTVTSDNPMPGNGTDGADNVEQVRSTSSGTQIYKVKAMSTIDGASSESFAVAGAHAVQALQTPIPSVALSASPTLTTAGAAVTVTANVTNQSADLASSGVSVTLSLPSGVALSSGTATQSIGALGAGASAVRTWTATGSIDGAAVLSAAASGTTYGETFSGSGQTTLTIDALPPELAVNGPGPWSALPAPTFSWSATDVSGVDHYDVELARGGGAFTSLLPATALTSTSVSGAEGEQLSLRVRAVDTTGTTSAWKQVDTTIDAVLPAITIGTASFPSKSTVVVPVAAANVGSPLTTTYAFGLSSAALKPLTSASATFSNGAAFDVTATLRVQAVDALGRVATELHTYKVPTSLKSPGLKISSAKYKRGVVTVSGRVASSVKRVSVTVKRRGSKGTKSAKKSVSVRSGRFSVKLKVKPGKYKATVTSSQISGFASGSAAKNVR